MGGDVEHWCRTDTFVTVGGTTQQVSPQKLTANSASEMEYVQQRLGNSVVFEVHPNSGMIELRASPVFGQVYYAQINSGELEPGKLNELYLRVSTMPTVQVITKLFGDDVYFSSRRKDSDHLGGTWTVAPGAYTVTVPEQEGLSVRVSVNGKVSALPEDGTIEANLNDTIVVSIGSPIL